MRERFPLFIGIPAVLVVLIAWVVGDLRRSSLDASARRPSHSPRHALDAAPVRRTLREVDTLRRLRQDERIPMGGVGHGPYQESLDRVRSDSEETLHYLEALILDRSEDLSLRVDLLNVVAFHRGEETRRFLAALVADPSESPALRVAAIAAVRQYKDEATFQVLRGAYLDPAPFDGRYHVCVALGESGHPDAVPLLLDAAAAGRAPDLRAHAVAGLGGFANDPGVAQELLRLAGFDPLAPVRRNAMRALSRSSRPEADAFLRTVAVSSDVDSATRRLAEALLQSSEKSP